MHESRRKLEDQENAVISAEHEAEVAQCRASDAERHYLAAQDALQVKHMLDKILVCVHM